MSEVQSPFQKHLGLGTVVAPDGGKALQSAAMKAGRAVLRGVNHQRKVFTPVSKVEKEELDSRTTRMLRRHTKGKKPAVKETKKQFVLPGRDNSAEGTQGHVKSWGTWVG